MHIQIYICCPLKRAIVFAQFKILVHVCAHLYLPDWQKVLIDITDTLIAQGRETVSHNVTSTERLWT